MRDEAVRTWSRGGVNGLTLHHRSMDTAVSVKGYSEACAGRVMQPTVSD